MANPPDNNQLDTGPGGFVIDEPGVKNPGIYAYDVGSSSRPGDADYPVRDISRHGGNVNVDHSPKDISPATKTTLADYLGKKTSTNYYKVDGDTGYVPLKIAGENNTTPPIPAPKETTKNSKWFTQGKDNIGGVTSQSPNLSLRGWMTTPATPETPEGVLKEVISKGKEGGATAGSYDGNELLSKIDMPALRAGEPPPPFLGKIAKYQNAVLSNNRFAMTAERSRSFDSDSLVKKSSKRNVEGVSSTTDSTSGEQLTQYNPTFYHPKYGEITAGRLAQIGTALSLRASGEFTKASEAANDPNVVQTSWLAKQLTAQKIDLVELEVDRVIKELKEEDLREVFYTNISDSSSWGSINNVLAQNAGWSSMAMAALAIAMSAGIGTIVGVFFNLILNNISALGGKNPNQDSASSRLTKGSSTSTNEMSDQVFQFFANLIGMVPTTFSYSESVGKGNAVYFGLDGGGITNFLSTAVLNTVRASGQIVPTARLIIRSSVSVYDNFAEAFSPGLGGFNIDRIARLLSALESIGRSKLMAALNMFATIGDAVLTAEYYKEQEENLISDVHDARVPGTTDKLSWASNMAPSRFLVPNIIFDRALSSFEGKPSLGSFESNADGIARQKYLFSENSEKKNVETNRISTEDLEIYESELDSEYVPFYFHDVRTNEIVAFHAFLESLSDDYTASYDSIEGIGRIEPVKIYKGTQRKIGMSFFVVSTSPQDFEDMWVKINKLTTLVYPQYSRGRYHEVGESHRFVQPFSQLVGASPLIRIRLGNLLRSNYSKFALARLFGAELADTKFISSENLAEYTALQKELQNVSREDVIVTREEIHAEIIKRRSNAGSVWFQKIYSAENFRFKYTLDKIQGSNVHFTINGVYKIAEDESLTQIDKASLKKEKGLSKAGRKNILWFLDNKTGFIPLATHGTSVKDGEKNNVKEIIDIRWELENQKIEETKDKKARDSFYDREYARKNSIDDFMSEEKNALVKSFKSASGKGLAGVIESMSFDWYSNVTWDVDPDKKAPKMCKVTISFSPMHDISPGLDSSGYNRAPIYPRGN
jgi:hypothetical protein